MHPPPSPHFKVCIMMAEILPALELSSKIQADTYRVLIFVFTTLTCVNAFALC